MSDKDPFSAETIKEFLGMEPGWKLGEEEVPIGALGKSFCAQLKDEHSS